MTASCEQRVGKRQMRKEAARPERDGWEYNPVSWQKILCVDVLLCTEVVAAVPLALDLELGDVCEGEIKVTPISGDLQAAHLGDMMLARRFRQLIVSEIDSSWGSKYANALVPWTTSYKPFCSKNLSPYREQCIDWSPDVSDSFDPQVGQSTITKCTATPVWPQTVLRNLREKLSVFSEAEQINTWMHGVACERDCLFHFPDWVFCKTSINIVCKRNFKCNCHFIALME